MQLFSYGIHNFKKFSFASYCSLQAIFIDNNITKRFASRWLQINCRAKRREQLKKRLRLCAACGRGE